MNKFLRTSRTMVRRQINIFNQTQKALRRTLYAISKPPNNLVLHELQVSASTSTTQVPEIEQAVFEEICNETLESLTDYFEEIVDSAPNLKGADVTYSDGVLTVALGGQHGTYVINRQTPNKQIWLSSPKSGPKRYDLVLQDGGYWIYKHDGKTLHQLLQDEISKIAESKVEFKNCTHSLV